MTYNTHPNQLNQLIDTIHSPWSSAERQLDYRHFLELDKILEENECNLHKENMLTLHNTNKT